MVGFAKKSKVSKKRGTREHGRGKKKGRGAGLRGGRGRAGFHKHNRVKWALQGITWGRHGFKLPEAAANPKNGLNVGDLDQVVARLVETGHASKEGDAYVVDLGPMGYDKLLGGGQVRNKLKVTVGEAAPRATEKVEGAGGSITTA